MNSLNLDDTTQRQHYTGREAPALDWQAIDHVLLDMDGTLLDLRFDNRFWLQDLPARYAESAGLSPAQALARIRERMAALSGRLEWYCIDAWTRALGVDVAALKRELAHGIRYRDTALAFLEALTASGRQTAIVTNAHPDTIEIKQLRTDIRRHVDAVFSSHAFGAAKEQDTFWPTLAQRCAFDPRRTLFIDDSLPVLRAARRYGITQLRAVSHPDSSRGANDTVEFQPIRWFTEIMPIE